MVVGELSGGSDEFDLGLFEERDVEMEYCEEIVISEVNVEIDYVNEIEDGDLISKVFKFVEFEIERLNVEVDRVVFNIFEVSIEEGKVDCNKFEINMKFNRFEVIKLGDS